MQLTEDQILKAINLLNIPTNNDRNGDWLSILCPEPSHDDKNYGNCSINLKSGKYNCFSCHQKGSIIDLIKQRFNIDFKQAMSMIDNHWNSIVISPIKVKKKKVTKSLDGEHYFTEVEFDPKNYYYTRQRGFTKEFNRQFNITKCLSGIYTDYMVIPCIDSNNRINEFECRKLKEYETLQEFFNSYDNFDKLKRKFERYCSKNEIVLRRGKLYKQDKLFYDEQIKYLLKPKVLYVADSQLYRTLWNIDNLKYDEELWVTEGIASLPKIWGDITKNCTCTFGSKIDEEQIKILQKFKKVVIIPDHDEAGYLMIQDLNKNLNNFVVKNIKVEDTDKNYVKYLLKAKELKPNNYLSKHILRKEFW